MTPRKEQIMGTYIVGGLLILAVVLAVRAVHKNVKSGGCAGGCSGCSGGSACCRERQK